MEDVDGIWSALARESTDDGVLPFTLVLTSTKTPRTCSIVYESASQRLHEDNPLVMVLLLASQMSLEGRGSLSLVASRPPSSISRQNLTSHVPYIVQRGTRYQ